jgi:hypothetical protein
VVDGEEELFLAPEVLVDGAAGVPGGLGDLLEGGPLESAAGEDVLGRVEQDVPGVLTATFRSPSLGHVPIVAHRIPLDSEAHVRNIVTSLYLSNRNET